MLAIASVTFWRSCKTYVFLSGQGFSRVRAADHCGIDPGLAKAGTYLLGGDDVLSRRMIS